MIQPRYPIYVPSKGRWQKGRCLTVRFLLRDETPFRVVCEQDEADQYASIAGHDRLLVLPESGQGLIYARNWIKQHATAEGYARHWQIDDNIHGIRRYEQGYRIPCDTNIALAVCEDFTDRYTNVALSGLNYDFFVVPGESKWPPFYLNARVYSCTLVNNATPHRWRIRYNDDVDMCLQVLADGWCTLLLNQFLAKKTATMKIKGGNTDDLYQGDGRLTMARTLERMWPGIVQTDRRFKRPQHVVPGLRDKKFDTQLIEKADDDPSKPPLRDYGLHLVQQQPIKSERIKAFMDAET